MTASGRRSVARIPGPLTRAAPMLPATRRADPAMIDKTVPTLADAVAGIADGSTVLVGGFATSGVPLALIDALLAQGARELTIVSNHAGNGDTGLAALLAAGRVRRIVCSFPRHRDSWVFDGLYKAGRIELELVPQGTMAERLRAAGAGIGAFYTPTAYGTDLASGKETRVIDGRAHVLETPLHGDVALVCADRGDRWGNLVYRRAGRNFGPVMAMAARRTIAQVREIVPLGALDPEAIVTPGIFVARVVQASDRDDAAATPRAA
jgi:3-oxoadipate CoA-transferase alpha subunit